MSKTQPILALCALGLLGLLAACVRTENSTPYVDERNPFSLDIAGMDGAEVSWQGYTDGYRPGRAETMHLSVWNSTDRLWAGRICLQLLEARPSSVVIPLAEQTFDLASGAGFERDVVVDLPADLSLGTYGLALVVHKPAGPIVSTIPVQVGVGERRPFQGQWPTAAALEACPDPEGTAQLAGPAAEVLEAAPADSLVNDPGGLCEWAVWGRAGQDLYVWAVCEASSGTAASVPAVVRLSIDGQVAAVRLPRDGTDYALYVREFSPDVQEREEATESPPHQPWGPLLDRC